MKKIYILIYVWRGLTTPPEIFYNKKDALKRENEIKEKMNPDFDEVAVYKKIV
ncbi:MAG TPA: hypothetical protein VJY62_07875 [Bacteroidia bacterium]|nr:hypothetical protein [Bacteroidia bacterium]